MRFPWGRLGRPCAPLRLGHLWLRTPASSGTAPLHPRVPATQTRPCRNESPSLRASHGPAPCGLGPHPPSASPPLPPGPAQTPCPPAPAGALRAFSPASLTWSRGCALTLWGTETLARGPGEGRSAASQGMVWPQPHCEQEASQGQAVCRCGLGHGGHLGGAVLNS